MSALYEQARQFIHAGDRRQAMRLLQQVVTHEPGNAAAWEMLAEVAEKREHAIDCLQRALRLDPTLASAQQKLASLTRPAAAAPSLASRSPIASAPSAPSLVGSTRLAPTPTAPPPPAAQPKPAIKRCPYCAEEIQAAAILCRHCGRDLVSAAPAAQPRLPEAKPVKASTPPQPVAAATPKPGSYVDANLMPNEQVLYRAQLHWVVFVRPLAMMVFGLIFIGYFLNQNPRDPFSGALVPLGILLGIGIVILGLIVLALTFLVIRTTEFALTNKRVIGKRGIIWRRSLELLLPKVESIAVDQPIMGRLLNYGSVVLTGTGGTRERLFLIADPMTFRRRVQQQLGPLG